MHVNQHDIYCSKSYWCSHGGGHRAMRSIRSRIYKYPTPYIYKFKHYTDKPHGWKLVWILAKAFACAPMGFCSGDDSLLYLSNVYGKKILFGGYCISIARMTVSHRVCIEYWK